MYFLVLTFSVGIIMTFSMRN